MHHSFQALAGCRIVSLALNLPGPAALMRLCGMGAHCTKLEAPAPQGHATSDPMGMYAPHAYRQLHEGIVVVHADLKTPEGKAHFNDLLTHTDVLITSFRPAALARLQLDWETLHTRHPQLNLVQIVGATGLRANEAGHDLTYQAEAGLVPDLNVPASLAADMAGALTATEAVLQTLLARQQTGTGQRLEVGLLEAAQWLSIPRQWGMTTPEGITGGAHAGYRLYACMDGRVAIAALEPHFAQRLWQHICPNTTPADMLDAATHQAISQFCATQTRAALEQLAQEHDIPLLTLP
ncbi:CoA transferase [Lampropedia puyangensis]|uniref:CoA transferase n=1 Tax=Lampropedia puyangensis TaxID=1330072 RepID=A0A4S8F4X6_9BURK|nr:CoA transferase [Lampropedia puyangensis]THU02480.1 CoA transferase [Lampropedia puyangensis]